MTCRYNLNHDEVYVRVRSLRGEVIELSVPKTCTIYDLRNFLVSEYHYDKSTRLIYNNAPADDNTLVADYPLDSLIIATQDLSKNELSARKPTPKGERGNNINATSTVSGRRQGNSTLKEPAQSHRRPMSESPHKSLSEPKSSQLPARSRNLSPPSSGRKKVTAPLTADTRPKKSFLAMPAPMAQMPPPPLEEEHAKTRKISPHFTEAGGTFKKTCDDGSSAQQSFEQRSSSAKLPSLRTSLCRASEGHPAEPDPKRTHSTTRNAASKARPDDTAAAIFSAPENHVNREATPKDVNSSVKEGETQASWQCAHFMVHCHIPALNRILKIEIGGDATVADLMLSVAAEVPAIAGSDIMFRGKVLSQHLDTKLFNCGIRGECTVFIASGEFSNPDVIAMKEIEFEVERIEEAMKKTLSEVEKKGYYEELMRILFRADGLQELVDKWKLKRKDMVKRITGLQDLLNVDGNAVTTAPV